MERPCILAILDGWGYRTSKTGNAIAHAQTPTMDMLRQQYPWTTLAAHGTSVGTLPGYIGNSQIGHMTIGSGRIIEQPLTALSIAMDSGSLAEWTDIDTCLARARERGGNLHIMGLLSDGGVHSHEHHMHTLIRYAATHGFTTPILHPFLDGRDVPPMSAGTFLSRLEDKLRRYSNGYIATLMGRYYAMDRDENWQRTCAAYHALTQPNYRFPDITTPSLHGWHEALTYMYQIGITDEFVPPIRLTREGYIADQDGVIFVNFRADRARQLTAMLCNHLDISEFRTSPAKTAYTPVHLASMITGCTYHPTFGTTPLYRQPRPEQTLCDIFAQADKRIFRIAETQKYAHVTYFFNGGDERTYAQETRTLIPSRKVSTFDQAPHMSADEITDAITRSLDRDPHDLYVINYANPDMVAHTGNFEATKIAVSHTDAQIGRLYEAAQAHNADLIITADHGNAEDMYYPQEHTPRTNHTRHPVPCVWITQESMHTRITSMHGLADIAPEILRNVGLPVPDAMQHSYGMTSDQDGTDT